MDEKYKNHSKHHCFTKQIYEDLPRNRVEESLDVLRLAGVVASDIQLKCWTSNTMYNIPEKYVIVHAQFSIRWIKKEQKKFGRYVIRKIKFVLI